MRRYENPENIDELNELVDTQKRELLLIGKVYSYAERHANDLQRTYDDTGSAKTYSTLRIYQDIMRVCDIAESAARHSCSRCDQRRREISAAIRTFEARANASDGRLDANEVLRELEFLNKTY